MKVLKNFKQTGKFIEEFPYIKIKQDEDIYAELPICLAEYGIEYVNPMLFIGPDNQAPVVMEEKDLIKKIEGTKLFHFKIEEEGKVKEVAKTEADFSYRLPIDVPVDKLAIIQGQLGILEDTQTPGEEVK